MKWINTLFFSLLLAACSTPYVSVTSGPVAEVTFGVEGIDGPGFLTSTEVDFNLHKCYFDRIGEVKLTSEKHHRTVNVKAGVPLNVIIGYFKNKAAGGTETSNDYITFIPKTNGKYQITFTLKGSRYSINVSKINASGKPVTIKVKKGSSAWERCPK